MKKLINLMLVAAIAIVATPLLMYAQDTTHYVGNAEASGVISVLYSYLQSKYPIIATITTVLFLVSEILAGIPSIKANSVFQLVYGILKTVAGKATLTVLLIVFSVSMIVSCNRHDIPAAQNKEIDTTFRKEKLVYRDTTIIVPGVSILIHDTLPCKEATYHFEKDSGNIKATVDINKGVLTVSCKEDSLKKILLNLASDYIELYKEKNKTVTVTVPGRTVTDWYIPKWIWYLIGFNVVFFGWKIASAYLFPGNSFLGIIKHWFTKWKS